MKPIKEKNIQEKMPVGTVFTIENDLRVKGIKFVIEKYNSDGSIDIVEYNPQNIVTNLLTDTK